MDTVALIVIVVIFRYFISLMKGFVRQGSQLAWIIVIVATVLLCASPLILIKKEILENSVANILLAGFSLFYFPFVVGKMPEKIDDKERE